jgi:hypothetical protein
VFQIKYIEVPKDELLERIVAILKQLPEDEIQTVADFVEFLLKKDDGSLKEHSGTFAF